MRAVLVIIVKSAGAAGWKDGNVRLVFVMANIMAECDKIIKLSLRSYCWSPIQTTATSQRSLSSAVDSIHGKLNNDLLLLVCVSYCVWHRLWATKTCWNHPPAPASATDSWGKKSCRSGNATKTPGETAPTRDMGKPTNLSTGNAVSINGCTPK